MAPFAFGASRSASPSFGPRVKRELRGAVDRIPERELPSHGWVDKLRIHLAVASRHPRDVIGPALRSWAPMLPLSVTDITAAAVTPTFVMLFTDEFWWIRRHLEAVHVWSAALVAIPVSAWLVLLSQRLFFPHHEKRLVTEHVALGNVAILLAMTLMTLGLFVLVTLLVLLVEVWLFPERYIAEWFADRGFEVGWIGYLHIAMVVSTLGTLTGALGGSLHGRGIIRKLALFLKEP